MTIITLFNFCVEEFASHLHPLTVHVVLTLILKLLLASIEFVDYILFPSLFSHVYCKNVASYENKNVGVFVMSTENYLTNFYPDVQTVLDLYYSLAAVNAELEESGKKQCTASFLCSRS